MILAAMVIVGFFGTAICTSAQMDSADFQIRWDTVGTGGNDTSSSASYVLHDTTGNPAIGGSASASYQLGAGYRQGESSQLIDFSFFAQDAGVATEANALAGTVIDCSPVDFSIGDMVALLQDKGESQVTAIGRVQSVGVDSITLDALTDGGVAPIIDGTNDYVYLLGGNASHFGTLRTTEVSTSVIGMQVTADLDSGYVVQLMSDGDFRNGSDTVNAVSDGTVSIGSEEYGARSSDTLLADSTFDSEDTAITTSFQTIADSSDAAYGERNFLVAKAAISATTAEGSYAQTLTLIVSGNF